MRDLFFKLLPYAAGAILVLLFFFPPDGFGALGPWRHLIPSALMAVGILAFAGLALALNFPKNVVVEVLSPDSAPPDIAELLEIYRSLGFALLESPVRVHTRPSSMLWVLANRELSCLGTVFSASTIPRRVGFGFGSTIEGERGNLTSTADWATGTMPLDPKNFKQILQGASPAKLLSFHREAQQFLAARGVHFALPLLPEGGIAELVRKDNASKRRVIAANPLKVAALMMWRAATHTSPYIGLIAHQKTTERKLQNLQEGSKAGPGAT